MRLFRFNWNHARQAFTLRDLSMVLAGAAIAFAAMNIPAITHGLHVPLAPESAGITARWIPDTVRHWQAPIDAMAKRYNVDPNFIAIIMTMESGGYAKADSGQAEGLIQIAPATAKDIAARYLKKPVKSYDLWDPATNIEFGAAYLAKLRDIYGSAGQGPSWTGTAELVAAAYNGGFGAANSLEQGNGLHDVQTVVYSRDAFNMWREHRAADSPTFDRWKERGGSNLLDAARTALPL